MPQLTAQSAKAAESNAWDPDQQGGGWSVLEDGDYLFQLTEVKVSDAPGPSGYHYWTWIIEEPESKTRIWEVTSLSPGAIGKIGQIFAAFGEPATAPTENLLGRYVGVSVIKTVQAQGKNKGKDVNEALAFWPAYDHPEYDPDAHGPQAKGGGRQASPGDFGGDEPEPPAQAPKTRRKGGAPVEGEPF